MKVPLVAKKLEKDRRDTLKKTRGKSVPPGAVSASSHFGSVSDRFKGASFLNRYTYSI